jgi:hypothetical protein
VRVTPVGPVLPVVALVVRLRADLQVLGGDACPVVTPVPILAIAGLGIRNIMGYTVVVLLVRDVLIGDILLAV